MYRPIMYSFKTLYFKIFTQHICQDDEEEEGTEKPGPSLQNNQDNNNIQINEDLFVEEGLEDLDIDDSDSDSDD